MQMHMLMVDTLLVPSPALIQVLLRAGIHTTPTTTTTTILPPLVLALVQLHFRQKFGNSHIKR